MRVGICHMTPFRDGVGGAGLTWAVEFRGLTRTVQVRASVRHHRVGAY